MNKNWLARKIELIPLEGESVFFSLSILRFFAEGEGQAAKIPLSIFSIEPFSVEVPGVETIDFVPVIREISQGRFQLEGVPCGPLCGVG